MFSPDNPSNEPLLLAHRGSRLLAPENTSIAFDMALAHGSHVLEIDVRLSRDHQVIVTHDANLDRTSDGSGDVIAHPLSLIKKLNAGYRFIDMKGRSYRDAGATFLTLTELLERYPRTPINIDIKDKLPSVARVVADVLIKANCADRVNVGSFHSTVISAFREHAPHISTAATQMEVAELYARSCLRIATPITLPAFNVLQIPRFYRGIPLGTSRFIRYLHKQKFPVMFWTINDPGHMQTLLEMGADGIVTDRTDLAQRVFKQLTQPSGTKP